VTCLDYFSWRKARYWGRVNESDQIDEWDLSHTSKGDVIYRDNTVYWEKTKRNLSILHHLFIYETCNIYKLFSMEKGTILRTCGWVMSDRRMRHVTYIKRWCNIYPWVKGTMLIMCKWVMLDSHAVPSQVGGLADLQLPQVGKRWKFWFSGSLVVTIWRAAAKGL